MQHIWAIISITYKIYLGNQDWADPGGVNQVPGHPPLFWPDFVFIVSELGGASCACLSD